MKFKKWVSLLCVIVCICSMIMIPVHAVQTRASDQIDDYLMNVVSDNGKIYVDFSVTGTGTMKKIGCESIYIYESSSGHLVESFDENDAGMSRSNAFRCANTISVNCDAGVRYRIKMTIFAENSAGRDTRSQTFYVTGQA